MAEPLAREDTWYCVRAAKGEAECVPAYFARYPRDTWVFKECDFAQLDFFPAMGMYFVMRLEWPDGFRDDEGELWPVVAGIRDVVIESDKSI